MTKTAPLRAGVMGWPVGHSLSPRLHGFWLDAHGIDGTYEPLAVAPENLEAALAGLAGDGFAGCNLTIPHKEAALGILDRVDDLARRIGAVNTVVVEDGRLIGSNTDGAGFYNHLCQSVPGWRADGRVVVVGAGGAARGVIVALLDAGMGEVTIVNRTGARAQTLAADLNDKRLNVARWEDRGAALADAGLVVNTTALGMQGKPPLDLALDHLPAGAVVYDIVYTPLETALLKAARGRGNVTVDGLGMLLHQAVPGFAGWFGVRPEVTPALRAHVLAGLGS